MLQHYNLVVPSEEQLYEIYRHFDRDRSYSLDVRESVCLVDAVVRAMFIEAETNKDNTNTHTYIINILYNIYKYKNNYSYIVGVIMNIMFVIYVALLVV